MAIRDGAELRSRRAGLREEAERASHTRALGLPSRSGWRVIAATELANEKHEQYLEDARWFSEQDEMDMDREMCDDLGSYSTEVRSAHHDDDVDDDRFDSFWDLSSWVSHHPWDI